MAEWYGIVNVRENSGQPGDNRPEVGDIVDIVPVTETLGDDILRAYIVVWFEGLTDAQVSRMCVPQYSDGSNDTGEFLDKEPPSFVKKRLYNIPLSVVLDFYPTFDINQARNWNVIYQPFMNEVIKINPSVLNAIRNKHTGRWEKKFDQVI